MSVKPIKSPSKPKAMATTIEAKEHSKFLDFDSLPDSGFVREAQLVPNPARPELPAPLPFSANTLWRKVKAGEFPAPVKLSSRVTCWNVGTVREWMQEQASKGYAAAGKRPKSSQLATA